MFFYPQAYLYTIYFLQASLLMDNWWVVAVLLLIALVVAGWLLMWRRVKPALMGESKPEARQDKTTGAHNAALTQDVNEPETLSGAPASDDSEDSIGNVGVAEPTEPEIMPDSPDTQIELAQTDSKINILHQLIATNEQYSDTALQKTITGKELKQKRWSGRKIRSLRKILD
ncbi:MAG: hypothetical protein AAF639_39525 [Chloroflexota bacterium]